MITSEQGQFTKSEQTAGQPTTMPLANEPFTVPFHEQSFVRSRSVAARVIAGETLLVPIRARVGDLASIYSFNGTGSSIWKLLETPRTVSELVAAVAQEYDAEEDRVEKDVREFLGEMLSVGLAEVPLAAAMTAD